MAEQKKKVMLIDDDPLVLKTILRLLNNKGYEVTTVESGLAAIAKITEENKSYDLIISDVRMPNLDGVKAVEEIQGILAKKNIKSNFMFITGYADEDAPQHAIRLGVTDFILKPFDLEKFLDLVEKNLEAEKPSEQVLDLPRQYNPTGRWQYPNKEFFYERLVTLKDTNMEGNVYFSNYFSWQGEAREGMLLSHPNIQDELKKYSFVKMITHSSYQRFVHEAFFGDLIQIKMTSREIKKCSFILVFRFFNKRSNAFLAEGWQRVAFADVRSGKICMIPPHLCDLVLPIEECIETAVRV